MTDQQTLLRLAMRCRRLAALCATEAIARKFEALALDYEEQARQVARNRMMARMEAPVSNDGRTGQNPSPGTAATGPTQS